MVELSPVSAEHLPAIAEMELESYPADEGASLDKFRFRLENAPVLFRKVEQNGELVGYVCGTLSSSSVLLAESMRRHEENGENLCLHSVVIGERFRKRGFGLEMVKAYVQHVTLLENVDKILLICKEHLIPFYEKAGFELVGKSQIVHGKDDWFEMSVDTIY